MERAADLRASAGTGRTKAFPELSFGLPARKSSKGAWPLLIPVAVPLLRTHPRSLSLSYAHPSISLRPSPSPRLLPRHISSSSLYPPLSRPVLRALYSSPKQQLSGHEISRSVLVEPRLRRSTRRGRNYTLGGFRSPPPSVSTALVPIIKAPCAIVESHDGGRV